MFHALLGGLVLVLQWPAFGYLLIGILLGIWLGAVPGLGGAIGLVIVLPFTFHMDSVSAFALMLGLFAVTSTGDTISSVMLGIPGTAASQATILDGYPLAMKGQAARALGAAYAVSMVGGVLGAFVMAVSLPFILPLILKFGMPEFFMLAVLGLTMVGSLSGGNIMKGIAGALIGLLVTQVGYGQISAVPRFTFGVDYLLDGVPLVPTILGLFALPEMMELGLRDASISRVPEGQVDGGGTIQGIRDAIANWWLVLRCSAIGVYIGMIPGLGGAIVDWFAYGHTVQSAKDKSQFGRGDIRGVIGPETANNAVRGGSLIPTVAFGIPGSFGNAILLSAMLIHGLNPGLEMLTKKLSFTFSFVWDIVLANIIAAVVLMFFTRQVAKIVFVRGHLIIPAVILFVYMGAWLQSTQMGDWVVLLSAGAVGFWMKRGGWPRPPVVLALVLGRLMEQAYYISLNSYGPRFLLRPISLIIIGFAALTIFMSVRGVLQDRALRTAEADAEPLRGEGQERNPLLSAPFAAMWLFVFGAALVIMQSYPPNSRMFPLATAGSAVVLFAVITMTDLLSARRSIRLSGSFGSAMAAVREDAMVDRSIHLFMWLVGIAVLTYLFGQLIALPVFIALYLWRWGGYGWKLCTGYALAGLAALYGYYDQMLHVIWQQPLLLPG